MTQEQDKTQAAGDEVKTERKKPGPKPKTAQSTGNDVKQSDQNATAKNSEETGNDGTETQASESASSSQTVENPPEQGAAPADTEKTGENDAGSETDQNGIDSLSEHGENQAITEENGTNDTGSVVIEDAANPSAEDGTPSATEVAEVEIKASESSSSSQTELEVEQQTNSAAGDQAQQGGDEKNNEEIVVQKKTIPQPHNPLEVTVRNNGLGTIYEPSTKTSIKACETVTIECPTNTVKQTVLGNIKQFKALGKNVEVLNGRS